MNISASAPQVNDAGTAAILGWGQVRPKVEAEPFNLPDRLSPGSALAHRCPESLDRGIIPSLTWRRLGRAQKLALLAAQQALKDFAIPKDAYERAAVCLGTGLGELGETAAFLENLIRLDEREPRPTRFTNSVHNSLASQIAIQFKLAGENHTITHGPVSFELAIWQAMVLLKTGRAGYVLACGVDELNPYAAYAGYDFGFWRITGGPQPPGRNRLGRLPGTFSGEGAAAFLLGGSNVGSSTPYIKAVKVRPLTVRDLQRVSPQEEVDFLKQTITGAGLNLGDLDLILTGADCEAQLRDLYLPSLTALSKAGGKEIGYGLYKNLCGEFCSASAIGLALAVEMLQGNQIPPGLMIRGGREPTGINNILLYQIAKPGFHSACLVGR